MPARRRSHINADIETTKAWMVITGQREWKLMLEDLCSRTFFNPPKATTEIEAILQQGEQRLLRFILGRCSPSGQQAILDALTEEALTDG